MAILIEIVKTVLVIILIASFFELLLPEGKVKPFVRFAIGLFILISILNPTLNYLYSERDFQINLWTYTEDPAIGHEIMESGNKINAQIMQEGNGLLKEKLEGQISAVVLLVPGVTSAESKVQMRQSGEISDVHILIGSQDLEYEEDTIIGEILPYSKNDESAKKAIEEKTLTVVRNMYSLENVNIQVEFKGG
ncbi:MAG TPA: stage III sporulation protein AF [Syntrophomonadaceae bacterium]|nr:stage III sporulation protein AF [Syntrophomonadaceae bacterium]